MTKLVLAGVLSLAIFMFCDKAGVAPPPMDELVVLARAMLSEKLRFSRTKDQRRLPLNRLARMQRPPR